MAADSSGPVRWGIESGKCADVKPVGYRLDVPSEGDEGLVAAASSFRTAWPDLRPSGSPA